MKKLLLIAFTLWCVSLGFGQGVIVAPQTALKSINGVTMPIANATISVCAAGAAGIPCSPVLVSTLFKDAALTIPLSNPFTADVNGNYQFAIAPGTYTVTVTAFGFNGYSYQITVATPISLAGGLHDPGANGPITRNGLNTTRPSTSADIIGLWSGSCDVTTLLRGDGSCAPGSSGTDNVQQISVNTTLSISANKNYFVQATAGVGGITVTLPTAVGIAGQTVKVKKVDTAVGAVAIATTSAQTIDGTLYGTSYSLTNFMQFINLESDGSNWNIVAAN